MRESKKNIQRRATFLDTLKAQEELRKELDRLELENDIVTNRSEFFRLIGSALLGLESEKECNITLPDGTSIHIQNIGKFIRHLAYYPDNIVTHDFLKLYWTVFKEQHVNISDIWCEIKYIVFGIYPEALAMSVRISKEQTYFGPSVAAKV